MLIFTSIRTIGYEATYFHSCDLLINDIQLQYMYYVYKMDCIKFLTVCGYANFYLLLIASVSLTILFGNTLNLYFHLYIDIDRLCVNNIYLFLFHKPDKYIQSSNE